MKKIIKIVGVLFILTMLFTGCSEKYDLKFSEVSESYSKLPLLKEESIGTVMKEINIDEFKIILYTTQETDLVRGGLKFSNEIYDIGEVSMEPALDEIYLDKMKVFNKDVLNIKGILGANYGYSDYIFIEDNSQLFRLRVDGNTEEIDIDDDGIVEVISTLGTIPETKIYRTKEGQIFVANINESINAKAVLLKDRDKKVFEVYFQPNKPKLFQFKNDNLNSYRDW